MSTNRRILKWIEICLAAAVIGVAAFALLALLSSGCQRKAEPKQLPCISITTGGEIPWDKRTPCSVTVTNGHDSITWGGKIKFRGGVSSKFYKHSYALKLSNAHELCGLPENRSWILNASYIDKTFMRHKLCYDLFRQMDSANIAPLCAYALVRENGKPQGLYVVMQRLNEHTLPVRKGDPDAVIFKEPKLFYPDERMPENTDGEPNFQEQTYPDFKLEDRNPLISELRDFIVNTPDEEFYATVGQKFDLQNIVDWHLFLLFINGGDNVLKNFYLYRTEAEAPYRIALWDCDHSFGRDGDNEKNMLERMLQDRQNILLDRMLKSPEYQNKLSERYRELRKSGIFSYENIEKMMQENDTSIRLGLEENLRLWPFDSKDYYDAASYDEEYALILEFVKRRLSQLDEQFGVKQSH